MWPRAIQEPPKKYREKGTTLAPPIINKLIHSSYDSPLIWQSVFVLRCLLHIAELIFDWYITLHQYFEIVFCECTVNKNSHVALPWSNYGRKWRHTWKRSARRKKKPKVSPKPLFTWPFSAPTAWMLWSLIPQGLGSVFRGSDFLYRFCGQIRAGGLIGFFLRFTTYPRITKHICSWTKIIGQSESHKICGSMGRWVDQWVDGKF